MISEYDISAPVNKFLGFIIDIIICHIRILVSPVSVDNNDVRLFLGFLDHTSHKIRIVHVDNNRAVAGRQLVIRHLDKAEKCNLDSIFFNDPEVKKIIVAVIKASARNILFIPIFARHICSVNTHIEHVVISHICNIKTCVDQSVSHLCRGVKVRVTGCRSECCGKRCLLVHSCQIR